MDVVVEKSPRESSVVATLGPGNFFGEMILLTGAARTATIQVKEDAELIIIDKESLGATLVNNPSIAESLSRILTERQAGLDAATLERRKKDASGKCSPGSVSSSASRYKTPQGRTFTSLWCVIPPPRFFGRVPGMHAHHAHKIASIP